MARTDCANSYAVMHTRVYAACDRAHTCLRLHNTHTFVVVRDNGANAVATRVAFW